MTEYKTMRVPQAALEAAREAKEADETWGEYLLRCADADIPQKWTEDELRSLVQEAVQEQQIEGKRQAVRIAETPDEDPRE